MFDSFFPKPKMFFLSAVLWVALSAVLWYTLGAQIGHLLGFSLSKPSERMVIGLGYFYTSNFLWFDLYYLIMSALFSFFWLWYAPQPWQAWSVWGTVGIIFFAYVVVQVNVVINAWFGLFYNDIQKALNPKTHVQDAVLYRHVFVFAQIVFPYIFMMISKNFFLSHYVFRWRNAMNNYYLSKWQAVRHIEGASQRIQEDTMRFATIMEDLGVTIIDAIMTLIAFIPVLAVLSTHVTEVPFFGHIKGVLIYAAILWSLLGTALLMVAGIKLPGLNFKNQRVEAALRKELVHGEDDPKRAQPLAVKELFNNVRRNYFKIYFHYTYFNMVRYFYIQADAVFVYLVIFPTIVSGLITLGIMNQIIRAFNQVASSFQFLVNSWTTLVELASIRKRLLAFEKTFKNEPLDGIENPS